MSFRDSGQIYIKYHDFSITTPLENDLWTTALEPQPRSMSRKNTNAISFQSRFNWKISFRASSQICMKSPNVFQLNRKWEMSSRASSQIHIKYEYISMMIRLENELWSFKSDLYQIWSFPIRIYSPNEMRYLRADLFQTRYVSNQFSIRKNL